VAAHRLARQLAAFHATYDILLTPGLATLPVTLGWNELKLRRLLDREVGGLGALEDLVHGDGRAPKPVSVPWSVRYETTGLRMVNQPGHRRQAAP